MGRLQHDLRRDVGVEGLLPAAGAQAPAVARLQAGEAILRHWRTEIVAGGLREGEELGRHHDADRVEADILAAGVAATVAVEAGHGLMRARLQGPAQHVDRRRASGAALVGRLIEHTPL